MGASNPFNWFSDQAKAVAEKVAKDTVAAVNRANTADEIGYWEGLGVDRETAIILSMMDSDMLIEFFNAPPDVQQSHIDSQRQQVYWMLHPEEAEAYAASQRGQQVAMREAEVAKGEDLDRRRKADPELAKRVGPDGGLTEYGIAMLQKERAVAAFKKKLPVILLVGGVGVGAFLLYRRRRRG